MTDLDMTPLQDAVEATALLRMVPDAGMKAFRDLQDDTEIDRTIALIDGMVRAVTAPECTVEICSAGGNDVIAVLKMPHDDCARECWLPVHLSDKAEAGLPFEMPCEFPVACMHADKRPPVTLLHRMEWHGDGVAVIVALFETAGHDGSTEWSVVESSWRRRGDGTWHCIVTGVNPTETEAGIADAKDSQAVLFKFAKQSVRDRERAAA